MKNSFNFQFNINYIFQIAPSNENSVSLSSQYLLLCLYGNDDEYADTW
jgi:hypothetical protein